jgi:hypothetical protein
MSQAKISIALSPEIHRAAKMRAIGRGSLTGLIEDIIDSRLSGTRLQRPEVTIPTPVVRPSVLLDAVKLAQVESAAKGLISANSLISLWVSEHFSRQVSV